MDRKGNCVLMGDINAKNTSWNCEHNCSQGLLFEEACADFNVDILNRFTITRYNSNGIGITNIDLIISTLDLVDISTVAGDIETYGSDHLPVILEIDTNPTLTRFINNSNKIETKRTDWSKFIELLSESEVINFCNSNVDEFNCIDIYIIRLLIT